MEKENNQVEADTSKLKGIFSTKRNHHKSQIATLLILLTLVILVFVLITMNIGYVSNKYTIISNAADSSALMLASQLANVAYIHWEALDFDFEVCWRSGWLLQIISIILIAIGVLLCWTGWGTWLAYVGVALLAGGIGGMAVAGYINYGTIQGAILGALQGVVCALAIVAMCEITGPFMAWLADFLPVLSTPIISGVLGTTVITLLDLGGLLAFALASIIVGGAMVYNKAVLDKDISAMMKAFARGFEGLGDEARLREEVFLNAFFQTVDDPHMLPDLNDVDGDGDTTDLIPRFTSWWDVHIRAVKAGSPPTKQLTKGFLRELALFAEDLEGLAADFDRREIECDCRNTDSWVIELWRTLESYGYPIDFWEPGPNKTAYLAWLADDCIDGCPPPPAGYDEIDDARRIYELFIQEANFLLEIAFDPQQGIGVVDATFNTWIHSFYDPNSDGDFYDGLNAVANGDSPFLGVPGWINNTAVVRDRLPGCQLQYGTYQFNTTASSEVACNGPFDFPNQPIYPCNWRKSYRNRVGIHLPNYPCKLYPGDKSILLSEIQTVEDFVVQTLTEEYIINRYFLNPCPGGTLVGDIIIDIVGVGLQGNINVPGSRTPLGSGMGQIVYTFDYQYDCETCDAAGCTTTTIQDTMTQQEPIRAPDLDIPQIGPDPDIPLTAKENFLEMLDDFRNTLTDDINDYFATIDEDSDDEFEPVFEELGFHQDAINDFLPKLVHYYNARRNAVKGGENPLTYTWTDSLGEHSITVEIGDFSFAYFLHDKDSRWYGHKECVSLMNWCNNLGSICGTDNAWVRVTRRDPANKEVGLFNLKWSPRSSGRNFIEYTRESHPYYSVDQVGISYVK